jgi:RNA polymerase sigma factor (sigma-70 family)
MTSVNNSEISELVKKLKQQDRKSQEVVYKRYFSLMMSMAMRYCENWDDSKDVVNTSFFKIFTKIENYQGKGSFEGWMKRTLINTALDFLKSKKFEKVNVDNIDSYDENVFIENDANWNINSEDILLLVRGLPEATRVVFNLYIMEGYKHKEISEMLGISEGTSHWHVLNARRLLQEKLKSLI